MDELQALTLGGDDYITKPYNIPILLARINLLLRRGTSEQISIMEHNGIQFNLIAGTLTANGKEIELTKTELAKHLVSGSILATMVRNREIHREYLGISRGRVTPSSGTITAPLGRKDGSIIERTIDFEHGESAITHYEVLEEKNGHSLIRLTLETGRTHQILIHMKYLGYPLIGDSLYNPDMEWISRQALHATRLRFHHPITKEPLEFHVPLPQDMQNVLEGIRPDA